MPRLRGEREWPRDKSAGVVFFDWNWLSRANAPEKRNGMKKTHPRRSGKAVSRNCIITPNVFVTVTFPNRDAWKFFTRPSGKCRDAPSDFHEFPCAIRLSSNFSLSLHVRGSKREFLAQADSVLYEIRCIEFFKKNHGVAVLRESLRLKDIILNPLNTVNKKSIRNFETSETWKGKLTKGRVSVPRTFFQFFVIVARSWIETRIFIARRCNFVPDTVYLILRKKCTGCRYYASLYIREIHFLCYFNRIEIILELFRSVKSD